MQYKMDEADRAATEAELKHLVELRKSEGWRIYKRILEAKAQAWEQLRETTTNTEQLLVARASCQTVRICLTAVDNQLYAINTALQMDDEAVNL